MNLTSLHRPFLMLAAATLLPLGAHAFSITTEGVVGTGYDSQGLFFNGVQNSDISGMHYSMTTTIDPTGYGTPFSSLQSLTYAGPGTQPWTVSLTLNGITNAFAYSGLIDQYGQTTLAADATRTGMGNYDAAYNGVSGQDSLGLWVMATQSVATMHTTGITLDFDQKWAYSPQNDDWNFTTFTDPAHGMYLFALGGAFGSNSGSVDYIAINGGPDGSTVPEPASIGLMGLAVLCATLSTRRRTAVPRKATVRR